MMSPLACCACGRKPTKPERAAIAKDMLSHGLSREKVARWTCEACRAKARDEAAMSVGTFVVRMLEFVGVRLLHTAPEPLTEPQTKLLAALREKAPAHLREPSTASFQRDVLVHGVGVHLATEAAPSKVLTGAPRSRIARPKRRKPDSRRKSDKRRKPRS